MQVLYLPSEIDSFLLTLSGEHKSRTEPSKYKATESAQLQNFGGQITVNAVVSVEPDTIQTELSCSIDVQNQDKPQKIAEGIQREMKILCMRIFPGKFEVSDIESRTGSSTHGFTISITTPKKNGQLTRE